MTDWLPNPVAFIMGLVILLGSAELLVRNATILARLIGKSSLFIGLTIAAFGTSAPELAIGITGLLKGEVNIGLGNIVGSNIFNILCVLGLAAVVRPIMTKRLTVQRDIPILLATCLLFFLLTLDGAIGVVDSGVLLVVLVGYLVYLSRVSADQPGVSREAKNSGEKAPSGLRIVFMLFLIVVSIALMMIASRFMVTGAIGIATRFGMSEFAIGLTIVAMGTSLPEIATTLAAVRQEQYDLAIGNVLGSCFFNIIAVPAAMAVISAGALPLAEEAIWVDIPIMVVATVALLPIFVSDHRLSRAEGVLFLAYYAVYVLMLYFRNASESILSEYQTELVLVAVPVIAITMSIITVRAVRQRRRRFRD